MRKATHFRSIYSSLFGMLLVSAAHAHPGHGEPGTTHYFNEPAHAIPLLIMGAVILFLVVGCYKTKTSEARAKV